MSVAAPSERPLDAVTFDFWNTLCYEPDLEQRRTLVLDAFGAELGAAGVAIDPELIGKYYDEARHAYWEAWRANRQFTGVDAALMMIDRLDGAAPPALRASLVASFSRVADEVEVSAVEGVGEAIEALRGLGLRIGIVCDVGLIPSVYLRRHLERLGLLDLFDYWSFSDDVGVYKPDTRIFEHALEGVGGVVPGRAAHVGDRRRTDVAGALGMGMRAVRFAQVFDDTDPEEGPSGDVVIGSYGELLPALGLADA